MIISLIVAAAENNAIGKNNQLLWHLPNDMKLFKNTTWAMPVVMGRKTFESLGKPLNGRVNIVLTKQKDWKAEGVVTVHSLKDALFYCSENLYREVFIIGGAEIYNLALEKADNIYLTRVKANPEADTFFSFDTNKWKQVYAKDYPADDKHAYPYSFQLWKRS